MRTCTDCNKPFEATGHNYRCRECRKSWERDWRKRRREQGRPPMNDAERARVLQNMNAHTDKSGSCWEWTGCRHRSGYGKLYVRGKTYTASRLAYELQVGPIPPGLQIDHLCRNRACVNPSHMETVTNRENTIRGFQSRHDRGKGQ